MRQPTKTKPDLWRSELTLVSERQEERLSPCPGEGWGAGEKVEALLEEGWVIEKYHFMILHTLLTLAYYLSDKHHVCLVYAAYILVYAMPLVISIHKSLKLQTTVCF